MSLITGVVEAALKIIDKVIPDPQAKAAAQLEVLRMQQAGQFKEIDADLQVMLAQAAINQAEAASEDKFVSGWRPAVGWVSVTGLAFTFVVRPGLSWLAVIYGWPEPPNPDLSQLFVLLAGMLGFGGLRTFEKLAAKKPGA